MFGHHSYQGSAFGREYRLLTGTHLISLKAVLLAIGALDIASVIVAISQM